MKHIQDLKNLAISGIIWSIVIGILKLEGNHSLCGENNFLKSWHKAGRTPC